MVFNCNKSRCLAIVLMWSYRLLSSGMFFASEFIDVCNLGGTFLYVLWHCHEEVSNFVVLTFHRYYLFCLGGQKPVLTFIFGMPIFNFYWNVSFIDRNLMFDIKSKNSSLNACICLHCGGVLFYLMVKSFLWISFLFLHWIIYWNIDISTWEKCEPSTANHQNFFKQGICNAVKVEYEEAIKKSGYNVDFKYTNNKSGQPKMQKQNVIWFNPLISKSVSTIVVKTFHQWVTKIFLRNHKLHKSFSHITVKVSYSCKNNMSKIIIEHNKKVTSKQRDQTLKCNSRKNIQWKGTVKLIV